jgi:hypothetical protein
MRGLRDEEIHIEFLNSPIQEDRQVIKCTTN